MGVAVSKQTCHADLKSKAFPSAATVDASIWLRGPSFLGTDDACPRIWTLAESRGHSVPTPSGWAFVLAPNRELHEEPPGSEWG